MCEEAPISPPLLALLLGCHPPPESFLRFSGEAPRNVLILSVDTLRRDAVGRYGGHDLSPTLDRLLSEGVALDNHRSCSSWTYPSVICALSGDDQLSNGFLLQRLEDVGMPDLPEDVETVATLLRRRGFSTALVSGNTFTGSATTLDRGYERLFEVALAPADQLIEQALAFQEEMAEGRSPYLLHLHLMDPHMPYTPPEGYITDLPKSGFVLEREADFEELMEVWDDLSAEEKALAREDAWARYSGEIRFLDEQIARLLGELEARGALSDTLVMLFADHGEQLFEHDLFAHGNGVHFEENAVIAGFWSPTIRPRAWSGPTIHQDLMPTLLAALAETPPEGIEGQVVGGGRSRRCASSFDEVVDRTRQSVEEGDMKLIYGWEGRLELYNTAADPAEQFDLFTPGDPDAARLWALLKPEVEAAAPLVQDFKPVPPEL